MRMGGDRLLFRVCDRRRSCSGWRLGECWWWGGGRCRLFSCGREREVSIGMGWMDNRLAWKSREGKGRETYWQRQEPAIGFVSEFIVVVLFAGAVFVFSWIYE